MGLWLYFFHKLDRQISKTHSWWAKYAQLCHRIKKQQHPWSAISSQCSKKLQRWGSLPWPRSRLKCFEPTLLLLLKKIGNASQGEGDWHPISPKTPAPYYQPIEEKKRKGKKLKTKKERATRPTKRHWTCSWNPPIPHHRIRGQPDRSREILRGDLKSCGTARYCNGEAHKYTDVRSKHRV